MAVITVLGSLNVDMVTVTPRVPEGGETLQAKSFETGWGGKGANQAVAAARTSRRKTGPLDSHVVVRMVGAVGDDVFGPQMIKSMARDGIDMSGVRTLSDHKTGTAVILVEQSTGQNRILFTAGANFGISTEMELVKGHDFGHVAIFQLETPRDVVFHNIKLARAKGAQVILNPAPAQELPDDIFPELAYLVVNETEAAIVSGQPSDAVSSSSDLDALAAKFIGKGVKNVIVTLGSEGVYYQTATAASHKQPGKRLPAVKATVVDTTAAGDTFVGAFAVKLAEAARENVGDEADVLDDAIAFAIRAAGKTVEKAGAQSSIPWLDEL
ncbi:ribokinase [Verruconis gallopava]|uniref:Ribokinase n=1 Tax=Verruconis gallopava TaxID=253628 RepID=A0A0D1XWZ4_9PEZI|nr:ribokinase [Verruconis gallopava]KIW07326.1 ribokinase [Verruconis gallopava]